MEAGWGEPGPGGTEGIRAGDGTPGTEAGDRTLESGVGDRTRGARTDVD